jgi:hypothetical protein
MSDAKEDVQKTAKAVEILCSLGPDAVKAAIDEAYWRCKYEGEKQCSESLFRMLKATVKDLTDLGTEIQTLKARIKQLESGACKESRESGQMSGNYNASPCMQCAKRNFEKSFICDRLCEDCARKNRIANSSK